MSHRLVEQIETIRHDPLDQNSIITLYQSLLPLKQSLVTCYNVSQEIPFLRWPELFDSCVSSFYLSEKGTGPLNEIIPTATTLTLTFDSLPNCQIVLGDQYALSDAGLYLPAKELLDPILLYNFKPNS